MGETTEPEEPAAPEWKLAPHGEVPTNAGAVRSDGKTSQVWWLDMAPEPPEPC